MVICGDQMRFEFRNSYFDGRRKKEVKLEGDDDDDLNRLRR